MNKYVRAFIAGSAFPVTIWPFLYLGIAFTLNPQSGFQMGAVAILDPIILGVFNILHVFSLQKWPAKNLNLRYLSTGAVLGLLLSAYGNFVSNLPTKLFLLSGYTQYITIPAAIIAYALIWRYVVKPLNELIVK